MNWLIRHRLRMRFDPKYPRRRQAISRRVAAIAEACDQLQVAYGEAIVRNQKKPVLRLVEPCGEDELLQDEAKSCAPGDE